MNIKSVKVGSYQTNCYIIEKDNKCLVIDPGDEYEKIKSNIEFEVIGVLITHNHFDHIGALEYFKDINIYDVHNLKEGKTGIGPFKFEVIYTPGHTSDSITYYFYEEDVMFTGDFLFYETIGRTDLETSDQEEMIKSINKIIKYCDKINIYPGHGIKTNLGYEKENNIYVRREL